jgi:predicted Zn-dependent peptidase
MNTIFGGNMSSRLFQKIRERRGLAYSVYSFISSFIDTGLFGAYVALQPDKAYEAIQLIKDDMCELKTKQVDEAELNDAKDYTKGNLLLASESIDNQMVRLAQNEINFGYHIPFQTLVEKIESVTEEDILDIAKTVFQENQLALTTLGPLTDKKAFEDILYVSSL